MVFYEQNILNPSIFHVFLFPYPLPFFRAVASLVPHPHHVFAHVATYGYFKTHIGKVDRRTAFQCGAKADVAVAFHVSRTVKGRRFTRTR